MTADVRIVRAGTERLDDIEPLWHALRDHHADVGAGVAPVRDAAESWRRRRAQYERWLATGELALLVAERDGRAVGYATLRPGAGAATWDLGERVAELETLSVLPAERGRGTGAALVEACREIARGWEAGSLLVGLVHTNEDARRFYEREGFRPFYLEMVAPLERR